MKENVYIPEYAIEQLFTMGQEIIFKLKGSVYEERAQLALDEGSHDSYKVRKLYGIICSLEISMKNNFLENLVELIHVEVFTDFLDMAEHLQKEGYKDASAVMIGTTLETDLKNLAIKNNIDITFTDRKQQIRPKRTDAINAELKTNNVYNKLDHKNITAWLELRNNAAHGNYDQYTQSHIEIMLQGVKDFIRRTPA